MNIFTQMNEPAKKDGIWIKTNHTYQNVMVNQQYTNRQSIVWNDRKMPYSYNSNNDGYNVRYIIKFRNKLYVIIGRDCIIFDGNALYSSNLYIYSSDSTSIGYELNNYLYWFRTDDGHTSEVYRYDGSSYTNVYHSNESHVCRGILDIAAYNNKILYAQLYYTVSSSRNFNWWFYDGNAFTVANYGCAVYDLGNGNGNAMIYPDIIFVLNGNLYYGGSNGSTYIILKYNSNVDRGIPWDIVCNLGSYYPRDVCVSNNEAYLLCGFSPIHILKYNGNSTFVDLGVVSFGQAISELNGNLYTAYWEQYSDGSANHFLEGKSPNKVYNPNTVIINKGDSQNGVYLTNMFDTSYMVGNNSNRFVSGFDDCFYFADTAFDWGAPMYYGNGSQWIKFKN